MTINRFVIQKVALALSLAIVLNLFVYVGVVNTFYSEPKYDNFCGEETQRYFETAEACQSVGGKWMTSYEDEYNGEFAASPEKLSPTADTFKPYCDAAYTCRENLSLAVDVYNRNIFIISIIVGTVALAAGIYLVAVSAISSGLLFGGVLLYFIGTVRYWSNMDEYFRLVVLTMVLIGLVVLGYKKLNDKKDLEI